MSIRAALGVLLSCAGAGLALPPSVVAADAGDPGADAGDSRSAAPAQPRLTWRLDAPLAGAGATLLLASQFVNAGTRPVPPAGLDRGDIHWSLDRGVIGDRSTQADEQSDYTRDVVLAYPLVIAFASQPSATRAGGTLRRTAEYGEALLLAEGLSVLLKNSIDRPRPYTYLSAEERPRGARYDVTSSRAFRSMPSGHAISSFCAAGFAMTDHLLSRPDAGWLESAAVPFVGGALAGATAALRVKAGQHFPSDVIAGGLIGASSGVAVPLLHEYLGADGRRAQRVPGRAWRRAIVSLLAGAGAGILAADALH